MLNRTLDLILLAAGGRRHLGLGEPMAQARFREDIHGRGVGGKTPQTGLQGKTGINQEDADTDWD